MDNYRGQHNTKKYKAELVDLLRRIGVVLSRNKISYFGVFGTCLGAAREGGIIPWDDDVDIAIHRRDFIHAKDILDESDQEVYVEHMGFRRARIFNRIMEADSIERKRAYVDLYVIDNVPENYIRYKWDVLWYVGLSRILARRKKSLANTHPWLHFAADFITFPFRVLPSKWVEKVAEWFYVFSKKSLLVKLSFDANRKRYEANWFQDSVQVPFDDISIPIPKEYDPYLTKCYGNWRVPPEEKDRYSHAFDRSGANWSVPLPDDDARRLINIGK